MCPARRCAGRSGSNTETTRYRRTCRRQRRVEAAVTMIAVEQRIVAQFVLEIDLGEVETAARGQRQPRRHVESVCGVETGIEGLGPQADRRHVAGRLVDEETRALHDRKLIGVDRSQFARRGKLHEPAVDADTGDEIVVVTEYPFRSRRLPGAAE